MAIVLVTGNPGAGKTELARELTRRGYDALDADEIAHWETAAGSPAQAPAKITAEWLAAHRWVWGRDAVRAVLDARRDGGRPFFLCGIAMDLLDLLDLVDLVVLLSLDDRTQFERLATPSNAGRNAAQRRQIVDGRPVFEAQLRAAGAVVLDGRRPSTELAEELLRLVERLPPGCEAQGSGR